MQSSRMSFVFLVVNVFAWIQSASAKEPSGSILWSNLSISSKAFFFDSVQQIPESNGDVVLLTPRECSAGDRPDCQTDVARMQPASGEFKWKVELAASKKSQMAPQWSMVLASSKSSTVAVAWAQVGDTLSGEYDIIAVETTNGTTLWKKTGVSFGDLPVFAVADGTFLAGGNVNGEAQALAMSLDDGKVLFNVSPTSGGVSGGWYAESVSLATTSDGRQMALLGSESGNNNPPGDLFAIDVQKASVAWTAKKVTTTHTVQAGETVVTAIDTRPIYGDTKIVMIQGYRLKDGALAWQRSVKGSDDDDIGVSLGRACDADCSLPCELVAAGVFGAVNATTGQTVYNISRPKDPTTLKNGIAYSIHSYDYGANSTLFAKACGNTKSDLWSVKLPGVSAPWSKVVVVDNSADAQAVVLLGGHDPGSCFRGHCSSMSSAIAGIRAPSGIAPPPVPPAPPAPPPPSPASLCERTLMSSCAKQRSTSSDECLLCVGEHVAELEKAGCKDSEFIPFCHTDTCDPSKLEKLCPDGTTCPKCGLSSCNCPAPKKTPPMTVETVSV